MRRTQKQKARLVAIAAGFGLLLGGGANAYADTDGSPDVPALESVAEAPATDSQPDDSGTGSSAPTEPVDASPVASAPEPVDRPAQPLDIEPETAAPSAGSTAPEDFGTSGPTAPAAGPNPGTGTAPGVSGASAPLIGGLTSVLDSPGADGPVPFGVAPVAHEPAGATATAPVAAAASSAASSPPDSARPPALAVLGLFGLPVSGGVADGTGTVPPTPAPWALLWFARRGVFGPSSTSSSFGAQNTLPTFTSLFGAFLYNAPPTNGQVDGGSWNPDGTYTGTVVFDDAEGDPVTYHLTDPPDNGQLDLDSSTGAFTFTPGPNYQPGDQVDFEVKARTENSVPGLFNIVDSLFTGQSSRSARFAVTLAGDTVAPQPPTLLPGAEPVLDELGETFDETGVVTGSVGGMLDVPQGTPISYVSDDPRLVVDEAGSFTFTPTAEDRHSAAAVPDGPQSTTITIIATTPTGSVPIDIRLPLSPVNALPTPAGTEYILQPADPTTGALTGQVHATDDDHDPLTYTGSTTTGKGTLTVNPDGTFTYTPDPDARHHAAHDNATTDDKTDTFTITADDAHGGTTTITVTVGITPLNEPPAVNAPSLDQSTGVVTGTITDADGDPLIVSIVGAEQIDVNTYRTAKGVIVVDPVAGTYTYTPNGEARLNASRIDATDEDLSDEITMRVSDLHGGETQISVGVPVAPVTQAGQVASTGATGNGGSYLITRTGTGTADDPYAYTTTAVAADGTISTPVTQTGQLYLSEPTGNGGRYLITYTGAGTPADPHVYTTTLITADGSITTPVTHTGQLSAYGSTGNGGVHVITRSGTGVPADPYTYTTTLITADGTTSTPITQNGQYYTSGATGNGGIYLITRTGTGTVGDPHVYTTTLITADGTTSTPVTQAGTYVSSGRTRNGGGFLVTYTGAGTSNDPYVYSTTLITADGTTSTPVTQNGDFYTSGATGNGGVYLITSTGTGVPADPYTYTTTLITMDGTISTPAVTQNGQLFSSGPIGDAGIYLITRTGTVGDPHVYTTTLITTDGTISTPAVTQNGQPFSSGPIGDGGAYLITRTGTGTVGDPHVYTTTLITTDGTISTPAVTQNGQLVSYESTRNGGRYLITYTGVGTSNDPYAYITTLITADGTTSTPITQNGQYYTSGATGDDGIYLITRTGTGVPNDPYTYTTTLITADGTTSTPITQNGQYYTSGATGNGGVYLITRTGTSSADYQTHVIWIDPNADLGQAQVAGDFRSISSSPDGTLYLFVTQGDLTRLVVIPAPHGSPGDD